MLTELKLNGEPKRLFRIEKFGSIEYDTKKAILHSRIKTLEFLKCNKLLNKYHGNIKQLWDSPKYNLSPLSLRLPILLQLEYTYKCNLNCKYCYSYSSPLRKEVMKFNEFRWLINRIEKEDIFDIHVFGGEPLIFPGYLKYMLANLNGKFITLVSNGTLLTDDICRTIVESDNIVNFSISIDGATKDVHDSLRGGFNRIIKTLNLLKEYEIETRAITCLTRYNYDKINELIELLLKYNVKTILFVPVETYHLPGHIANELGIERIYTSVLKKITKAIDVFSGQINIRTSFSLSLERSSNNVIIYGPCIAGVTKARINPKCQLTPCTFVSMPTVRIADSIEETFKHLKSELKQYINKNPQQKSKLFIPKYCESRFMWGYYEAFIDD